MRRVHEQAFGRPEEARLVDALRAAYPDALSLVAEDEGLVLGHVLFTPVVVESGGRRARGLGLAPLAVLPERQREGLGSRLVRRGLELLAERGAPFVVVLGHPAYYPRFGFERASRHGLEPSWEGIPDEAFQVLVLDARAMAGVRGVAHYGPEFDRVA